MSDKRKLSYKAIVISFLSKTLADVLIGMLYALVLVYSQSTVFNRDTLLSSIYLEIISFILSLLTAVFAGWLVYKFSHANSKHNITALIILLIIEGLLLSYLFKMLNFWDTSISIVSIILGCYAGGKLCQHGVSSKQMALAMFVIPISVCLLVFSTKNDKISGLHPNSFGPNVLKLFLGYQIKMKLSSNFENELPALITETGRYLPESVDIMTRLDKIVLVPENKLVISYTMHANAQTLQGITKQKWNEITLETACNDPITKEFLSRKITLNYIYSSNDGIVLSDKEVSIEDCNK